LKYLVFQDPKAGLAYIRKACDMGFGGGCSNLASLAKRRGNKDEARKLYQEACDKGDMRGCIEGKLLDLE
jgi:hypothetical protein